MFIAILLIFISFFLQHKIETIPMEITYNGIDENTAKYIFGCGNRKSIFIKKRDSNNRKSKNDKSIKYINIKQQKNNILNNNITSRLKSIKEEINSINKLKVDQNEKKLNCCKIRFDDNKTTISGVIDYNRDDLKTKEVNNNSDTDITYSKLKNLHHSIKLSANNVHLIIPILKINGIRLTSSKINSKMSFKASDLFQKQQLQNEINTIDSKLFFSTELYIHVKEYPRQRETDLSIPKTISSQNKLYGLLFQNQILSEIYINNINKSVNRNEHRSILISNNYNNDLFPKITARTRLQLFRYIDMLIENNCNSELFLEFGVFKYALHNTHLETIKIELSKELILNNESITDIFIKHQMHDQLKTTVDIDKYNMDNKKMNRILLINLLNKI